MTQVLTIKGSKTASMSNADAFTDKDNPSEVDFEPQIDCLTCVPGIVTGGPG